MIYPGSTLSWGNSTFDRGNVEFKFHLVSVEVETGERGISWVGDVIASGGTSVDGDRADGGDISFTTWGAKKASTSISTPEVASQRAAS